MTQFLLSFISLMTLTLLSFSDQRAEDNLRRLSLNNKVRFTIGALTDEADFRKLADMDERKVDSDLSRFKISRVSSAFMSKDGKYVMTFAKDSDSKIKRVIFVYSGGQSYNFADDVIDVKNIEIKTSKGSVSVGEGFLISN